MKTLALNTIGIALLAVCAANGETTGSVAGTVLENGTLPLAGATVTYAPIGHIEKDSLGRSRYILPQAGGSVQTHSDGTFTISGLAAGQYLICARGTLPIHISSCAWNTSDHRATITPGQNQTGLNLNVTRGTLLDIAIVDAAGCVSKNSKAAVYVFVGLLPQQTVKMTSTGAVFHYRALVPRQVPVRVSSNHPCSFSDSSGNALPGPGISIPPIPGESASVTMTAR